MTKELEDVYQRIADEIVNSIDTEWQKAWVYAEVEEDNAYYRGRFEKTNSSEKPASFFLEEPLEDAIWHLWNLLRNEDGKSWVSMTFTLLPTGDFTIDFKHKDEKNPS